MLISRKWYINSILSRKDFRIGFCEVRITQAHHLLITHTWHSQHISATARSSVHRDSNDRSLIINEGRRGQELKLQIGDAARIALKNVDVAGVQVAEDVGVIGREGSVDRKIEEKIASLFGRCSKNSQSAFGDFHVQDRQFQVRRLRSCQKMFPVTSKTLMNWERIQ